jgi:hypothetical protein
MTTPELTPMRPQDWFGVAIRTLGVWTLLKAMSYALSAIGQQNSWFPDSGTNSRYYYYYGLADLAAGLFMLLGADLIVGIAYRAPRPPQQNDEGAEPK